MRWEQTKKLEVPQGAAEGVISLWSLGTIKDAAGGGSGDSKVASYSLDTKKEPGCRLGFAGGFPVGPWWVRGGAGPSTDRLNLPLRPIACWDMLDKAESFFGRKQKFKLQHKGKTAPGPQILRFGVISKKQTGYDWNPLRIDEDSPLLIDVANAIQDTLDGEKKIAVLAKTLQGDLREIDAEGKEKGKVYVRVVNCNFAELKGEDMKEEWAKQCEKARKKGLKQPQRKWYFCWYGSKNEALDAEKWHFPDGFFPLATMTAVHRSPERQESERDQFLVKLLGCLVLWYSAGSKETLIYRREQGKALDAWVEGLDMANQEIRENMKEEKEAEEMEEKEKAKARMMHGQWMQRNGMPQNEEQWTAWFQWMKSGNLEDESIRNFYQARGLRLGVRTDQQGVTHH
ncbi:unnamed protein product [Durusdinium trenchii]|uniref:Uncharacterized protein n=1 Tax=Durusdinium trenchii TaxID=1381693 RepID=A0ABP0J4N7_9DINO